MQVSPCDRRHAAKEPDQAFESRSQQRATQQVLAPLPDSIKQQIIDSVGQLQRQGVPVPASGFSGSHVVSYNLNTQGLEDLQFPEGMIDTEECRLIAARLADRFGEIGESHFVLNLREHVSSNTGLLLFMSLAEFALFLAGTFPGVNLTKAEIRVVVQVLCGYTLREAAELDGVSHDTKRTQFSAVSSKTGVSRQSDLAVYVSTRLIIEIRTGIYTKDRVVKDIYDAHDQLMHPEIRLHLHTDRLGRQIRVMDMGPRNGIPHVVLHGFALPSFRSEDLAALREKNIRMVWPLRRGLMLPEDTVGSTEAYCAHYASSIEVALGLVSDQDSTPHLVTVGSGGSHGIDYVKDNPDAFATFTLVTPCFRSAVEERDVNLSAQGLDWLALNNPRVLGWVFRLLRKRLEKQAVFVAYMRGMAAGCEPDRDIVEHELSDPTRLAHYQRRTLSSVEYVVYDHCTRVRTDWNALSELAPDVRLVHGEHDALYPLPGIEELATACARPLRVLKGAGHLIYREHFPRVLDLL